MTKSVPCLSARDGYGGRSNPVHPGNMETPMLRQMYGTVAAADHEAAEAMDKRWLGNPRDGANMILFLAFNESCSVNGAEIAVDNTATITEVRFLGPNR